MVRCRALLVNVGNNPTKHNKCHMLQLWVVPVSFWCNNHGWMMPGVMLKTTPYLLCLWHMSCDLVLPMFGSELHWTSLTLDLNLFGLNLWFGSTQVLVGSGPGSENLWILQTGLNQVEPDLNCRPMCNNLTHSVTHATFCDVDKPDLCCLLACMSSRANLNLVEP
jgi:hypothetical protein